MNSIVPTEYIEHRIYVIRGRKVMLDRDLADLYQVENKHLTRQVRRNALRFPEDFAFQLTKEEWENLRCQKGASSLDWGGRRFLPYVFSEQGVGMLASVLKSEKAALVNVAIIRAFVRLREALSTNQHLSNKLGELERTISVHDEHIQNLFDAIRELLNPSTPEEPKRQIGYQSGHSSSAKGED